MRGKERAARSKGQGARRKAQGARSKEQGARSKEQGARRRGAPRVHPSSFILHPFFVPLLVLAALASCVTASRPDPLDFSSLSTYNADGLKLKLPSYYRRFAEEGASLFRPEPPVRPSPGVLVKREAGVKADTALNRAAVKVRNQMGGAPLAVRGRLGGKDVVGLHAQLTTHFIWIYTFDAAGAAWTLQIIAPVEWTDEQALAFHELVCKNVAWPE